MLDQFAIARVPLLTDSLITVLLFLTALGLGRRIFRRMGALAPSPAERELFALTLGLGAVAYLPFLLFALQIGKPPVVAGGLLLLFLLALPELWRRRPAGSSASGDAATPEQTPSHAERSIDPGARYQGDAAWPGPTPGLHERSTDPGARYQGDAATPEPTPSNAERPTDTVAFHQSEAAPMETTAGRPAGRFAGRVAGSSANRPTLGVVLFWCAALPMLLITLLQAFCPPTDPDGLYYHLTAPLRYLATGGFHYMPTFLHVNWPLGVEMLFALGMAFHTHYAASLVQFGMGLCLLRAVWLLCRRIGSEAAAPAAVALVYLFMGFEMATAYIDLGLALFTLMAVYAFYVGEMSLQRGYSDEARRWRCVGALCAGFAAASKLPGILTLVVLCIMATILLYSKTRDLRTAVREGLLILAIGLIPAVPWYLRCMAQTGSPFYPYFWSLFHARDWDAAAASRLGIYLQYFNTLRTRNPSPHQVVIYRTVACAVILALGLLGSTVRRLRHVRTLVVFAAASTFLQVASSGIYVRYFFPVLPIIFILLLRALIPTKWGMRQGAWLGLLIALRIWGAPHLVSGILGQVQAAAKATPVALGVTSREVYLTARLPVFRTMDWCNRSLPENAGVVVGVWDCYPSLLNCTSFSTGVWTQNAIRYDRLGDTLKDMRRLGATHLLVSTHVATEAERAAMNREDGYRTDTEFRRLHEAAGQCGAPLYEDVAFRVYALPWTAKSRVQ